MEATSLPIPGAEGWPDQFAATISQKRENAREFLAAQQERLRRAEAALAAQLQTIAEEVASERFDTHQTKSDLDAKAAELAAQADHLEKLKSAFATQQAEWETLHRRYLDEQRELARELERREAVIARHHGEAQEQQNAAAESLAQLQREKQAFEAAHAELERDRGELSAIREQLNALRTELERRREALDARAAETENARRRIAREFKSQHAAHLKELECRRGELEQMGTADQSALQHRCAELQKRENERETESNALRKRASELSAEIKSFMQRETDLIAEIKNLRQRETDLSAEIQGLRQHEAGLSAELQGSREREASLSIGLQNLRQRESDLSAAIQRLEQRETELSAEIKRLRQCEAEMVAEIQGLRQHEANLSGEVKNLQQHEAVLSAEAKSLRQREADLSIEVKGLRQRETDLSAEVKRLRQHETDLAAEVKSLRLQQTDLSTEQESAQSHKNALLRRLETGMHQQEEASTELHAVRQRCREMGEQLAQANSQSEAAVKKCEAIEGERSALQSHVADLESRLAAAQERLAEDRTSRSSSESRDDLSRRYEMAMEDLRELKAKNSELQQQLDKAPSSGGSTKKSGDVLNWEAEKKRILAALESDYNDEQSQPERMQIEIILRKTDAIVAEKNHEIGELKMLLENQSHNLGSVAVGAAALGQMFDQDAIIREERENLKQIQDEWREKLRIAEIEISVERAKLARDKSQLDERFRQMEENGKSGSAGPQEDKSPSKPSRGRRWKSSV